MDLGHGGTQMNWHVALELEVLHLEMGTLVIPVAPCAVESVSVRALLSRLVWAEEKDFAVLRQVHICL